MLTNLAARRRWIIRCWSSARSPSGRAFWWCRPIVVCVAAYNSNVLRRAEELFSLMRQEGKTPILYTVGRKALNYYKFRNWKITESWSGFSEQPTYENAQEIASHAGRHLPCRRRRRGR